MSDVLTVFDKTYQSYLDQVLELDVGQKADALGIRCEGDSLEIPFLNQQFRLTPQGIQNDTGRRPHFALCVVLCRYLIHYQPGIPVSGIDDAWTSFKDFKDAAPLVNYFTLNAENAIAGYFTGRVNELEDACRQLGGIVPEEELVYDLVYRMTALPRLPMLLLFNDADDEFPARSSILFDLRAQHYLDMECLAITGWLLFDGLKRASEGENPVIF